VKLIDIDAKIVMDVENDEDSDSWITNRPLEYWTEKTSGINDSSNVTISIDENIDTNGNGSVVNTKRNRKRTHFSNRIEVIDTTNDKKISKKKTISQKKNGNGSITNCEEDDSKDNETEHMNEIFKPDVVAAQSLASCEDTADVTIIDGSENGSIPSSDLSMAPAHSDSLKRAKVGTRPFFSYLLY
jgi:hypothetical protein